MSGLRRCARLERALFAGSECRRFGNGGQGDHARCLKCNDRRRWQQKRPGKLHDCADVAPEVPVIVIAVRRMPVGGLRREGYAGLDRGKAAWVEVPEGERELQGERK